MRRIDETASSKKVNWAGIWNSATTSYYLIVGATAAMVVLGLIMVLSSSSVESISHSGNAYKIFSKQFIFAVIGIIAFFVASRIKVEVYKKFAWTILVGSFVLQSLVFVPGLGGDALGNRNWIYIRGISLQPSEFMKVALAIFLGTVICRKLATSSRWLHICIPTMIASAIAIALVMAGNDLGTSLVLCLIIAAAFIVAGLPFKWIASFGALGAVFITLMVIFSGNRMVRILGTYDANCAADELCYQVVRGMEGLGSGGFAGVGLGSGAEKWKYLPEAQNDFIFSVIGEEIGFLGTTLVILLFVILGLGFLRVIMRHPDPMVKITTAGIAAWILGQAMINIGVVTRVLPVIGVPLPLVSAGGSALIATLLALGVVVAFARNEPGAQKAFKTRPSMVRKTIAVISSSNRRSTRGA